MNFNFNQFKNCVEVIQRKLRVHPVPFINRGGCGVFASILADHMTAHGIPEDDVKVVLYCSNGQQFDVCQIESRMRELRMDFGDLDVWCEQVPNLSHIRVSWMDYIFDAEDRVDTLANNKDWNGHSELAHGHFSHEAIREMSKSGAWNRAFDRNNIPTMEQIIGECFKNLLQ